MLKVGQTIMYRRDVCTVKQRLKNFREDQDYYKLAPHYDQSLLINAPVDSVNQSFRKLLTRTEIDSLISNIPDIQCVDVEDRTLEAVYKDLYHSEKHEDLVKIIKTAYMRGEKKLQKGLKRSERDKEYFRKAEKALYSELAVVLGKTVDDTREYVVGRVAALAG